MPTTGNRGNLGLTLLGLLVAGVGCLTGSTWLCAGGAIGFACAVVRLGVRRRAARKQKPQPESPAGLDSRARATAPRAAVAPGDTDSLAAQMLAQGRCALLLRPQIAGNLSEAIFRQAVKALEEGSALVPDGQVALERFHEGHEGHEGEVIAGTQRVVRVECFFLDRYPVTNELFFEFVAAGGYAQVALWDQSIWPAVLDFVDRTGRPGPRFWRDGCFPPGEERHPVVGVSWYEAAACARWLGKRLSSDAEWVKAGSWPVPLGSSLRAQRKYPWGDSMDRQRANVWGSGPEGIVPVDRFVEGASVGGVCQLIGNVWEWTSGNYRAGDHPSGDMLLLPASWKSIRGGAFDTYFDNQATCQFQSGESPLQRRHNIGFRCAVGLCDLQLARGDAAPAEAHPVASPPVAEEACA